MNDIQLFGDGEFDLTVEMRGETFIVHAPGLARGLGYRDALTMVRTLPEQVKGYASMRTSRDQQVWYVTEEGFYRAVGQRIASRIKNAESRAAVERFQSWVFGEVLPQLRQTGAYGRAASTDANMRTLNWDEVAAVLRQRYGMDFTAVGLCRMLRTAGVLKANRAAPMRDFRYLFWFSGTSFEVLPHAIPVLASRIARTSRELAEFAGIEAQLAIEGFGGPEQFGIEGGA